MPAGGCEGLAKVAEEQHRAPDELEQTAPLAFLHRLDETQTEGLAISALAP